jgi:hypothetical protein
LGFGGKPERKVPLENIKMGLKEIQQEGMDWIPLVQNGHKRWALVNKVMNLQIP